MRNHGRTGRRAVLKAGAVLAATSVFAEPALAERAMPHLKITGFELLPIRATHRTVWLIVRLNTDAGLSGLGEASDAFGFDDTTKEEASRMESELRRFFELIDGKSPLDVGAYRRQGEPLAAKGRLVAATAFSAIEQALWDLAGKALEVPTHTLLGGRVRDVLPVYANINRATKLRTPEGFAATAKRAVADGFRAVKAAPFDGFPGPGAPAAEVEGAIETGIAAMEAMRAAVGPDVELMVDCHSFFDETSAARVARRLEPLELAWYEEPVAPEKVAETVEIRRRIKQPMAGGELLFGVAGFADLIRRDAVHVIMPDVKHCGGLYELVRIAAAAELQGISAAPHNPSGPISTAASVQVCAVLKNVRALEFQWGEVDWRGEIVTPSERFENGTIRVPDGPGFGIELNEAEVRRRMT
jgi:galactonate dehydratase